MAVQPGEEARHSHPVTLPVDGARLPVSEKTQLGSDVDVWLQNRVSIHISWKWATIEKHLSSLLSTTHSILGWPAHRAVLFTGWQPPNSGGSIQLFCTRAAAGRPGRSPALVFLKVSKDQALPSGQSRERIYCLLLHSHLDVISYPTVAQVRGAGSGLSASSASHLCLLWLQPESSASMANEVSEEDGIG